MCLSKMPDFSPFFVMRHMYTYDLTTATSVAVYLKTILRPESVGEGEEQLTRL